MTHHKYAGSAMNLVLAIGVLATLAAMSGPAAVRACNVPVYRYAMENWAPAPFGIFYFYRGKPAEEDKQVNLRLAELAADEPARTNMIFQAVDVAKKEQLDRLNEMVVKVWRSHDNGAVPIHLVLTPWGAELFAGRLDTATLEAMIASPARTQAAELLGEGNAAVLLLLAGPDAEANKRVEDVIGQLIAKAAAGEIIGVADLAGAGPAAFLPAEPPKKGAADDETEPAASQPTFKLSTLKVSRTDPAEKWFVRLLMLIESDLHEYAKEPMIFTVFGRARALEPYIGKGITLENLSECAGFLGGACSCMVKEQNPGADLLMRWDWDATIRALPMDGVPLGDGQLVYQEFIPGESASGGSPRQANPAAETASVDDNSKTEPTAELPKPRQSQNQPEPIKATAASTGKLSKPPDSFVGRQMWKYGLGFAVAVVLVLGVGFVILRRQ